MNPTSLVFRRVLRVFAVVLVVFSFDLQAAEKNSSFRAALESINGDELLDRDKVLTSENMAGREAGTNGGAEARKYLIEQYAKFKLQPAGPDGKFEQPFPPNFCNVVGMIPGRDPVLKNEYVLIEAHYDHVGLGLNGRSFDPGGIHPGADDNASGTSGLIELVEAFSLLAEPPKRSVLILSTDGEEKGLLGSKYWADHPTVSLPKIVAAINMDMIGYLRNDTLYVYGTRTGAGWRKLVSEQNDELQMNLLFGWDFKPNSDSYPLFEKGVPALLLHTGMHENYHRVSDTTDKLNGTGMSRVVRLAFCLANDLADRPDRLAFRENAKRENDKTEDLMVKLSSPPPSRLGVTLDAASSDLPGVRIDKIQADSPALQAGLKPDDRILEFAGREVNKCDELIGAVMTSTSPAKALVRSPKEEKAREVQIELSGHALRLGITWRSDEAEPKSLVLTHIVPGTPAALAGLQSGDRVYRIGGQEFADENDFIRLTKEAVDSVDLLIERHGKIQSVHLDLKNAKPLNRAA